MTEIQAHAGVGNTPGSCGNEDISGAVAAVQSLNGRLERLDAVLGELRGRLEAAPVSGAALDSLREAQGRSEASLSAMGAEIRLLEELCRRALNAAGDRSGIEAIAAGQSALAERIGAAEAALRAVETVAADRSGLAEVAGRIQGVEASLRDMEAGAADLRGQCARAVLEAQEAGRGAGEHLGRVEERLGGALRGAEGRLETLGAEVRRLDDEGHELRGECARALLEAQDAQRRVGDGMERLESQIQNIVRDAAERAHALSLELQDLRSNGEGGQKTWERTLETMMYEVQEKIAGAMEIVSQEVRQAASRQEKTAGEAREAAAELRSRSEALEARLGETWTRVAELRAGQEDTRQAAETAANEAREAAFGEIRVRVEELRAGQEQARQATGESARQARELILREFQERVDAIRGQMDLVLRTCNDLERRLGGDLEQARADMRGVLEAERTRLAADLARLEARQRELADGAGARAEGLEEGLRRESVAREGGIIELRAHIQGAVGASLQKTTDDLRMLGEDVVRRGEHLAAQLASGKEETTLRLKKADGEIIALREGLAAKDSELEKVRQQHKAMQASLDHGRRTQRRVIAAAAAAVVLLQVGTIFLAEKGSQGPSRHEADLALMETQEPAVAPVPAATPATTMPVAASTSPSAMATGADLVATATSAAPASTEEPAAGRAEKAYERKSSADKPAGRYVEYTVQKDDMLWNIAKKHYGSGAKSKKIMDDNQLKSSYIKPGTVLKLYAL